MDQENIKAEATGGLEKDIMPSPPRKRTRRQKDLLAGIAVLGLLITVILCYREFISPNKSTDDVLIDGYVTLIGSRVPGQIMRLAVTDNQEVEAGDVLAGKGTKHFL